MLTLNFIICHQKVTDSICQDITLTTCITKVILPIHINIIYVHSSLRWRSYSKQLPQYFYRSFILPIWKYQIMPKTVRSAIWKTGKNWYVQIACHYMRKNMWHAGFGKYSHITNIPKQDALSDVLSLIHISEPTRLGMISYAVFCLKKKKK